MTQNYEHNGQRYGQQGSAQDARARYEDALRRSDERRASVQRGARAGYEGQRDLRTEEALRQNPPRRALGSELQQRETAQQRRVVRIESEEDARNSYTARAYQTPAGGRAAQYGRASGNYHARPATFSTTAPAPHASGRGLMVRAVIIVVLLVIAIISFGRISSAQSTLADVSSQVSEQQQQLDTLNESNESLQSQADEVQDTITAYNELVNSQS